MRFINTTTFKFHELSDSEVRNLENEYSILSHLWTWGSDEITYNDVITQDDKMSGKGGYSKFAGACALAKSLGYDLIWDDKCCINKTDSVELGEAINSMYKWYAESDICIAFLEDVDSGKQIEQSEWFLRGWTLQELIAPRRVQFYDTDWNLLGDKVQSQRRARSQHRNPGGCFGKQKGLASLFYRAADVLGCRADDRGGNQEYSGMLAPSPACFARSGHLVSLGGSSGFHINQFGLNIALPATPTTPPLRMYRVLLKGGHLKHPGQYALFLHKSGENKYVRVRSHRGESSVMTEMPPSESIDVTIPLVVMEPPVYIYPGFWLRNLGIDPNVCYVKQLERAYTTELDRLRLPDEGDGTVGIIQLDSPGTDPLGELTWIKIGFGPDCQPMCCMIRPSYNYHGRITSTSSLMRMQSVDLLRNPRGSSGRQYHPIFDKGWTIPSGEVLPGVTPRTYIYEIYKGGVDRGFDLTYKRQRFDLSVSAQRVPDMKQRNGYAPAEVWALDIVFNKPPPPPPPEDYDWCGCRAAPIRQTV